MTVEKMLWLIFSGLLTIGLVSATDFLMNSDIRFSIPQAQTIWADPAVLGDTTSFNYPLSVGTVTECERDVMKRVFDEDNYFHSNYTEWSTSWDFNTRAFSLFQRGYSFRHSLPDLKVEREILSREACFMACITLKEFVCREFDFFKGDSGVCGLHKDNGNYGDITNELFVGSNPSSDHFKLYPHGEQPPPCNLTEDDYAHPFFALGWKALEAGWYDLAHNQFRKALDRDPEYYMAYIGKSLANPDMGFGLIDSEIGSYRDVLFDISSKKDLKLKLTYQQMLLLKALTAFHSGEHLQDGLKKMSSVYLNDEETDTESSYISNVISGNAILLSLDSHAPLERHSANNIFALQYLTQSLNPYKAGMKRRSAEQRASAVSAVYTYQSLEVNGAWRITADCIDIAEYYAKWALGKSRLDAQRNFLFHNTGRSADVLFREEETMLVANGLDVPYMSRSLQRINEYERLHFFQLQLGQFMRAKTYLESKSRESKLDDDEERQNLRMRMAANAFFTTYDYIYDKYAQGIVFESDWKLPQSDSTNELSLASRAYYWTAAAVQKVSAHAASPDASTILQNLQEAKKFMGSDNFKNLLSLFISVIEGMQQLHNGKYAEALHSAQEAANINEQLIDVDWTVANSKSSKEFRLLIPLGFQFRADIFRSLYQSKAAASVISDQMNISTVISAYKVAVNTAPLNTSRLLKGYGDSLADILGNTPTSSDEDTPAHIQVYDALLNAWKNSDAPADEFTVKADTADFVDYYYNREFYDCQADKFQLRARNGICWGGYIIIGVALAVLVIIAIIIGILCLRKKAGKPVKHKEKVKPFSFSGPHLSSHNDGFSDTSSSESPPAYRNSGDELRRSFSLNADDPLDRSHTHSPNATYDYSGMYK